MAHPSQSTQVSAIDCFPASVSSILQIDLGAVRHNYTAVQDVVGPSCTVVPVVKSNAYGLGMERISQTLWTAGAREFFVATPAEGLHLRRLLPLADIYVLNGLWPDAALEYYQANLIPVLADPGQLEVWQRLASRTEQRPLWAILQIETGLQRLGFTYEELVDMLEKKTFGQGVRFRYIMSHLANGYLPNHPYNAIQKKNFQKALALIPGVPASLYASCALFYKRDCFDMVRPGCILYGSPLTVSQEHKPAIRPVVRWQARVLQVRRVEAGQSVGYCQTYVAQEPLTIATVGVGYADGYIASLGNRGWASIQGILVPIIGCVSMDLITLDVTQVPQQFVHPGSWVDLINEKITIDTIARSAGTICWEVLTHIGNRPYRLYT